MNILVTWNLRLIFCYWRDKCIRMFSSIRKRQKCKSVILILCHFSHVKLISEVCLFIHSIIAISPLLKLLFHGGTDDTSKPKWIHGTCTIQVTSSRLTVMPRFCFVKRTTSAIVWSRLPHFIFFSAVAF